MNRRLLLRRCCVGFATLLSGCGGDYKGNGPPGRNLRIRIREVRPVGEEHQLIVKLTNGGIPGVTIKDVTLLVYAENGELLSSEPVGTLDADRLEAEVTVLCSEFPEIISADAATSVCDELSIPIVYWVGTDDQKEKHIPEEITEEGAVYDGTEVRTCGESLPPERFVNDSGSTTETAE